MYLVVFRWPPLSSHSDTIFIGFEDQADLPLVSVFVLEIEIGALWVKFL